MTNAKRYQEVYQKLLTPGTSARTECRRLEVNSVARKDTGVSDLSEDTPRRKDGKPPISRHPLFPATVALWTGALFGVCSLIIGFEPFERAIIAAGIDTAFPAAAPPLGTTFRILLASAFAGVGGFAGAVLARLIARKNVIAQERKRIAEAVGVLQSPMKSATAKGHSAPTGAEKDSSAVKVRRRHVMADATEAPALPSQILNVREFELEGVKAEVDATDAPDSQGNDSCDSGREDDPIADAAAEPEKDTEAPKSVDVEEEALEVDAEFPLTAIDHAETDQNDERDSAVATQGDPAPFAPPSDSARIAPFAPPPGAGAAHWTEGNEAWHPAQFSETPHSEDDPKEEDDPQEGNEFSAIAATPAKTSERGSRPDNGSERSVAVADRLTSADLGKLSHVELLERLAISMERRRAVQIEAVSCAKQGPTESPDTPPGPPVLERLPSSERMEHVPEQEKIPPIAHSDESIPAALRPVVLSEGGGDGKIDGPLPSVVPPRRVAPEKDEQADIAETSPPTEAAAEAEGDAVDTGISESSEDEEQVVVFPSQAKRQEISTTPLSLQDSKPSKAEEEDCSSPQSNVTLEARRFDPPEGLSTSPNPAEAEQALRSALATLRQMNASN